MNHAAPAVALPNHIPSVSSGSYPVRAGNMVHPLIDGESAFTRICEAVEAAMHSVWVTVAYLNPDFEMPGGGGSFFDVLDRAKARGVDVRVIFWRTDRAIGTHFHGNDDERAWLARRGASFLARWDRAHKDYCQHQKSWLIDAGHAGEAAFVGGINLNAASLSPCGHANRDGNHTHDVYCELRGPVATDVHHNFVQRWNETSERNHGHGVWPDASSNKNLTFPVNTSPPAGTSTIQMQRTIRAGTLSDATATPGGKRFDIAQGEHAIFDQYCAAIDAARETIYIEDQYIASPDIVMSLQRALERGVDVVFLCPADPEEQIRESRRNPVAKPFYDLIGSLGKFSGFLLAGIAAPQSDGNLRSIYIHDKIMLVDDCWATIGSCNIASQSFFCDAELNASIWDAAAVRALRVDLLKEHLGADTSALDGRAALKLYRDTAIANRQAKARGEEMSALAFALDPAQYGA